MKASFAAMACALLATVTCHANSNSSASDSPMSLDSSSLQMGRNYQVITFKKGSNQLAEMEKNSLRSLMETAKIAGAIDRVHIIGWSDKSFPIGRSAADLPKVDRDLANARIEKVEEFLENQLNIEGVKTYSMAERANWFARAFNTDDAELKSLFAQKGADTDVHPEEFKLVKDKGGPMKTVILIQHKDRGAMMKKSPVSTSESGFSQDSESGTTTAPTKERTEKYWQDERGIKHPNLGDPIVPNPHNVPATGG